MRQLDPQQRARIVQCLCDGNSIRTTVRLTGVAKNTVARLLWSIGRACADFHDRTVRGLRVRHLKCDEIWSFVGPRKKIVTQEQRLVGWGDVWTWTAIDTETKLCISYHVGDRGERSAYCFAQECAERIAGTPQITIDARKPHLKAVEDAFGRKADCGQLHRTYQVLSEPDARYSSATCIGCDTKTYIAVPDSQHASTFTGFTGGFSQKVVNHGHAIALYFTYYNFCRVHTTSRVTPAMEAGLTDHIWTIEELGALTPTP